jgi:hypothetical protein
MTMWHFGTDSTIEYDLTYLQDDSGNNQRQLNALDDKKADPSADKGVDKIEEKDNANKHVDKQNEKESKKVTPSPPPSTYDVFSYKKHSMDYFTVDGVILRTGYADKKYWYILVIKELLDNAVDFLWKYYRGYSDASVMVYVTKDDSGLHIKIGNSNSRDIPVFQNLNLIFDPEMRFGSKQNEKVISRGMLGDAMKQILALPYVLIHSSDDGTAFTNEQWNKPLIIRCNGKETHVRIIVDKAEQTYTLDIKEIKLVDDPDTEIEVFLPLILDLDIHDIENFCGIYPLLTTDISFEFHLVDNSTEKPEAQEEVRYRYTNGKWLEEEPIQASTQTRKVAVDVEYPALHPISTKWNNKCSVHSLWPEEFVTQVTGVYDQKSITLYNILQRLREGNNIKKTDENQTSIAKFLSNPDYPKKLEEEFWRLKGTLDPPKVLSLPYSDNKVRKQALVSRVCSIYPLLDPEKAVYKVMRGTYNDDKLRRVMHQSDKYGTTYTLEESKGILRYPFAIEYLVVPYRISALNEETTGEPIDRSSKFIGCVNYSFSPRSNEFEGDYQWCDKDGHPMTSTSMTDILKALGFRFYAYSDSKTKIPSVIIVNIVSPRVDYHGHDKSRIDTHAFSETIIEATKKIADSIQTFRAAGFKFYKERHHDTIQDKKPKKKPEDIVRAFIESRVKGEHT